MSNKPYYTSDKDYDRIYRLAVPFMDLWAKEEINADDLEEKLRNHFQDPKVGNWNLIIHKAHLAHRLTVRFENNMAFVKSTLPS